MRTFGPAQVQLMLLRRMADYQPDLVEDAVVSLGLPRGAVADANRRWQAMLRSATFPGGNDRYRLILGEPRSAFARRLGDITLDVRRWPLPLWPDLRFETVAVPDGPVLQEWLVRPDPATRPRLESVAGLRPWACVVGDLEHAFGAARHHDDDAPSRWAVTFTADDGQGVARPYLARFVWGLLQTTTPL
ncbi:MAG TPA: hypothetical protein VIJ82_04745 [Streptosporangiaceae bacterium]